MSRICSVKGCNKRPRVANMVSNANNRVKKWVYPNVHKMRYTYTAGAESNVYRGAVCTKCIKSGNVKKVI